MGKRQHQKDKLYLTRAEVKEAAGEKKVQSNDILPFYCCCLSFNPFKESVCSPDGFVFDIKNIVPYIKKNHINPCTGKPLEEKDLIHLHWFKNSEGEYHCPVTYTVFNASTTIVTIRTSGNVYCYEAIREMNIEAKNWNDLLTGEPFTKSDMSLILNIIYLQNPKINDFRKTTRFYHVVSQEAIKPSISVRISDSMKKIIADARKEVEEKRQEEEKKRIEYMKSRPRSQYTTTAFTASITSSSVTPSQGREYAIASDEEIHEMIFKRARKLKKKGYIRIVTNLGNLNCEIHCDLVPRTAYNFMSLCKKGYYNNIIFHRLIKGFMIQGGDPTGTGTGGDSIYGGPFKDEFHPLLVHKEPGILSMANSGPNTNRSQFFITFASCEHLNNKHSVFGRVVSNLSVLKDLEKVATDKQDRPLHKLFIQSTEVIVNPFDEVQKELDEEIRKENEEFDRIKQEQEAKKQEYLKKKQIEKRNALVGTIPAINITSAPSVTVQRQSDIKKSVEPHKTSQTQQKPMIGSFLKKKQSKSNNEEAMKLFLASNQQYCQPASKGAKPKASNFDFSSW